jgi:hypothetical protein
MYVVIQCALKRKEKVEEEADDSSVLITLG